MNETKLKTLDGNEAAAWVAYRLNEIIVVYPITPASPMGEWSDAWAEAGVPNIWGTVPSVLEMQSEAGAAGAVHGALQTGSLSTTFTASQGLLLMLPNMYKIAGELTPAVFHVAARSLATQALSIFGDHSDVMAARGTGWAMLCSASVQEAHDFALISQVVTLESRVPVLHFFDGFRVSHETSKITMLTEATLRSMIDEQRVWEHRERALSPDHPVIRGTAQNPDVAFQARETVNPFINRCPGIVQQTMDALAVHTGRSYHLFDYHGAPQAERVMVLMGSGCEAAHETVDKLNAEGWNVGVLKVRLYRPFDARRFCEALPPSVRSVAVLDRTKEPGSNGEPLYLDCLQALVEGVTEGWGSLTRLPRVVGGRYGLSSKEFTPAMIKAVFENLAQASPKNHFTIGIEDDVAQTSLSYDPDFRAADADVFGAVFYGLGSDGTVGANKDTIKIIGENTDHYAQGYFVYDSKKSGAITVSHLRFGHTPIRSSYLISEANFVGCHQPQFIGQFNLANVLLPDGILLVNSPLPVDRIWQSFPEETRAELRRKRARVVAIDAHRVARECGMGGRINTVMQAGFFCLSGVLPREEAVDAIKKSVERTYARKGPDVVQMNLDAIDRAVDCLHEVPIPAKDSEPVVGDMAWGGRIPAPVPAAAPEFVRAVLGPILAGRGDSLPVSVFPVDGTYPVGTTRWEKRNLSAEIPVWDADICVQCGKCVLVCPHAVIRAKVFEPGLQSPPATFKSRPARAPEWKGLQYTLQVAAEDCTGCALCVDVCPVRNKSQARLKAINMAEKAPILQEERDNWNFFLGLPEFDRRRIGLGLVRDQQIRQPLFEFSGACAGCGETPYLKLLTQLFGDRCVIANATGCSSIYGGNLPTTPWTVNGEGRGPAWANSLFEDNAEFGLGFRVSIDNQNEQAADLVRKLASQLGEDLTTRLLETAQNDEAGILEMRKSVQTLKERLQAMDSAEARRLEKMADCLVRRSVWIIGGDGWAYDIGYGGLDHVLLSGKNVKVLVLDTEVYSNTGGQCSKATPKAAVAKFAAGGKRTRKKDLGAVAMAYGGIYVASIAMGARDDQTLKAFVEADQYDGPALIIAYSHCIAHGINMPTAMQNQKAAVQSGQWPLYRYNPARDQEGLNPLQLDCAKPRIPVGTYMKMENRFRMLTGSHPEQAQKVLGEADREARERWEHLHALATRGTNGAANTEKPAGSVSSPEPKE